jgi:hypothetical protein
MVKNMSSLEIRKYQTLIYLQTVDSLGYDFRKYILPTIKRENLDCDILLQYARLPMPQTHQRKVVAQELLMMFFPEQITHYALLKWMEPSRDSEGKVIFPAIMNDHWWRMRRFEIAMLNSRL